MNANQMFIRLFMLIYIYFFKISLFKCYLFKNATDEMQDIFGIEMKDFQNLIIYSLKYYEASIANLSIGITSNQNINLFTNDNFSVNNYLKSFI